MLEGVLHKAGSNCNDKCTDTFRSFAPAFASLDKGMAASGLAGPAKPLPPGKDDSKPAFVACSEGCNRECFSTGAAKKGCGGSCAEACGLYAVAT